MQISLTDALIESVLPNNMISVGEEVSLASRVEPYVKDAIRWLESLILGTTPLTAQPITDIAQRAAVMRAVITAIPSLDLVVTPTGFGVIRSNNLTPASKERIERLIKQLSSNLDELLMQLQEQCIKEQEWRQSSPGKWYCATFLQSLRDAVQFKSNKDLYTTYSTARALAERFEAALSESYLGYDLMATLRTGYSDGTYDKSHTVISLIRTAAIRYVSRHYKDDPYRCPDDHELWHAARAILSILPQYPDLDYIYESEKDTPCHTLPSCDRCHGTDSPNHRRTGGYFF